MNILYRADTLCEPILVLSWVSPTTLGQKEALAGLVLRALA